MFRPVTGVEKATANRHKGIIVLSDGSVSGTRWQTWRHLRLEKAVAVAVYDRNNVRVCDTDMIWLDSDHCSILLMRFVDCNVSFAHSTLIQEP